MIKYRQSSDHCWDVNLIRTHGVLNCSYNDLYSKVAWPMIQYMMGAFHTLSIVGMIKSSDILEKIGLMAFILLMTCFEAACFNAAANVYHVSGILQAEMVRSSRKREKLVGRSLRRLRVMVGSLYFFKTSTINTFITEVVNYVILILLTFRWF